jgi:hypothetical protein
MCKEYDRSTANIIHWESCTRSSPTLTYKTNADYMFNSMKRGQPYTTNKDTIINCLVLLFERVPEVSIDQNQGSMIDWVKEVNNEKYWKLLIQCLLKSTEEIPTRPTDRGWNQIPRPPPQPAPCPMPEQRHQQRQQASRRTRQNQLSNSNPPSPAGSPPQRQQQALPPPPPPRQDREPSLQRAEHSDRGWIALFLEELGMTH